MCVGFEKRGNLQLICQQTPVLGQDDPTPLSNLRKPDMVGRVLIEMVRVQLDRGARFSKRLGYVDATEAPIQEKSVLLVRLRRRC